MAAIGTEHASASSAIGGYGTPVSCSFVRFVFIILRLSLSIVCSSSGNDGKNSQNELNEHARKQNGTINDGYASLPAAAVAIRTLTGATLT